ncbi:uncharacterized protein LOC142524487 isoform X3 [Primulina tabacum]|uniref:uncharacterized protein LOC142524487 isoform X3 n=1 Tax=Primulina tabacum TaxID=48773 RepID=UPI003F5AD0A9
MKFEDFLMQPGEDKQTKHQLQEEVEKLHQELDGELQLNRVLQCAVQGTIAWCESRSCQSSLLPFQVQVLLTELGVVEEEIDWLERKISELKLDIFHEKVQIKERQVLKLKELQRQPEQRQLKKLPSRRPNQIDNRNCETLATSQNDYRRNRTARERRASLGSSTELQSLTFRGTNATEEEYGNSAHSKSRTVNNRQDTESEIENPTKLSVELVKCLIGIFLNLNKATLRRKGSANLPKNSVTCVNSKALVSKATFSCSTNVFPFSPNVSHLDPYEVLHEPDFVIRDVGPYKNFIQITKRSVDPSRLSECLPAMRRLRILMQKLGKVNITYLTHKQKLAFWINVYNVCVMHAFLQHGLPSTQEKLLALINEAAINVGGLVLHAFTIEHFILRRQAETTKHVSKVKTKTKFQAFSSVFEQSNQYRRQDLGSYDNRIVLQELTDEKAMLLRHACGLAYPEPNITFALCQGSWSSPALRFYTPDEVMNELEKAKIEYLEASVGITSKKKISVPKLLHWQMKDFADDMESLLEWIYSQLPQTSSLKRQIMESLDGETQSPTQKLTEIQPYVSEFRYLLPV